MTKRHTVVMVATSYPRFPGDGVGSFMEPIAKGIAARGHEVHLVAPWHPAIRRAKVEDGVHFHFFHYAPTNGLCVFGYASGMRADTALRSAAWMMAPAALAAGWFKAWRVATKRRATIMHGHWVIPGGVMAALARRGLPLVVSMHGSDVFVAEHHGILQRAARFAFKRAGAITACSDDLRERAIAIGADRTRCATVPYGVDTVQFAPNPDAREDVRRTLDVGNRPLVVSAGRLVRKKGFGYLIDAAAALPHVTVVIAGEGDLHDELLARAARSGLSNVRLLGNQSQSDVARLFAAADIVAIPSVKDDAGNVDGLPNTVLEAFASGTPVLATTVGGLREVMSDGVTGVVVPPGDGAAIARAMSGILDAPERGRAMGVAARALVQREFSWARVAESFEDAYNRAAAGR